MKNGKDLARRAALRLADRLGEELTTEVDIALAEADAPTPHTYDVALIVSIATLVVTTAQLAWMIYQDLRRRDDPIEPEALHDALRQRLEAPAEIPEGQVDEVVRGVVATLDESDL